MDPGKLRSLAHWVNSVGVGTCVESLQQLQDGSHFIGIIKIINGDRGTQFCDLPIQRFRLICSFLEDFYGISLQHHVDHTKILQQADIGELAKVAVLLLCAAVQGPKVDFFVDMITKLDMVVQTHLKESIEDIVAQGSGSVLQTNFASVLYKKLNEEVCTSSPVEPCTPLMTGCKTPTSSGFSPVKALFNTPSMVSKLRDRKVMYDKVRKLETDIANEKALRSDREAEILEKNAVIADRETKVKELTQQASGLKKLCMDVDSLRSAHDQLKLSQTHVARLERRVAELESVRSANTQLERQVERLVNENTDLEAKMRCYNTLKAENDTHRAQVAETQQRLREYHDAQVQLKKELEVLAAAAQEKELMLSQQREIAAEQRGRIRELEEQQLVSSSDGETLNIVPERRLGEIEAELQALKATWVQPAVHKQAVDQLRAAQEKIKELEESFQAARTQYQQMLTAEVDAARQRGIERYEELEKSATSKINSLENDLSIQIARNAAAEQTMQECNQIIEALRDAKKHLTQEASDARSQAQQQLETIAALETAKRNLDEEVRLASEQKKQDAETIEELGKTVGELRSARAQLTGRVSTAELESQQQREVIAGLKGSVKSQGEDLKSTREQLQHSVGTIQQSQQTIENLRKTIAGLRSTEVNLSQEVSSACLRAQQQGERVTDLERDKKRLEEELSLAKKDIQNYAEMTQELQKTVQDLQSTRGHLSEEVSSARQHANQKEETLRHLQEDKTILNQELKSSGEQIQKYKEMTVELQWTIEDLKASGGHLSEELLSARQHAKEHKEIISALEQDKKSLEEVVKSSQEQMRESGEMIKDLRKTVEDLKNSKSRLSEEITAAHFHVGKLEEAITNQEKDKKCQGEELTSAREQIQMYKEKLKGLQQTIGDLKNAEGHLSEELSSARLQAKQQEDSITCLENEKKLQEERAAEQIGKLTIEMQELQQTIEGLRTVEGHLSEEVATAQLQAKQQSDTIACLENAKQAANKEVDRAREEILQHKETISQLQQAKQHLVESLSEANSQAIAVLEDAKKHHTEDRTVAAQTIQQQLLTIKDLEISKQNLIDEIKIARQNQERQSNRITQLEEETQQQGELITRLHTQAEGAKKHHTEDRTVAAQTIQQQLLKIKDLEISKQNLIDEIKFAQQNQERQSNHITQLEKETQQQGELITKLSTQAEDAKKNHTEDRAVATQTIQQQLLTIKDLELSKQNLVDEIKIAQQNQERQSDRITQLEEETQQQGELIAKLHTRAEENTVSTRREIQGHLQAIKELELAKTTLERQHLQTIEELQTGREQLMSEIAALQTTAKMQAESLACFTQAKSSQSEEVAALTKQLEQHVVTISDLEEKLALDRKKYVETEKEANQREQALQDEMTRQTGQLQQLQQQFEKALADTAANNNRLVSQLQMQLENQQCSHKEETAFLKQEVDSKTEQLQCLESRMKFEKDSNLKEMQILQEELDHTKHLLEAERRSVPPPMLEPLPADASMHSLDSLDDGELNLAELETGSRASVASNASNTSVRSTDSSKSQCKYTIEIHSMSMHSNSSLSGSRHSPAADQLRLSTASNLTDSLNLSHLGPLSLSRASSVGGDNNLPEKVSQTINELSSSQSKTRSLRASMRQSKISRRTTGRAGFCLVGACEEEPEAFDWDRLSELQRRNTLCRPHLQTSYPVETQTRAPEEISENGLKQGASQEETESGPMTRSMRKRKSGDLQLPQGGGPAKMKTSNSYHAMPPPPPPDAKNTTKQSISLQNMKPSTAGGLSGSSTSLQDKIVSKTTTTSKTISSSSISSTVSNSSTTSSKSSRSSKLERAGILRASTKSNKSHKASVEAVKALKEEEKRRESIAFSIGFSPKLQVRRRSSRMSLAKKAANSPKVQATTPGITPSKKSRRRSIAKWLAK